MESFTLLYTLLIINALLVLVNGAPLTTNEGDTNENGSNSNEQIPDKTKSALMSSLPILRYVNSNRNFKVNFKEPNAETTPTIHIIDTTKGDDDVLKRKEAARRFSNAFDSLLSGYFGENLKFGDRIKSKRIYPTTTRKPIDSFNLERISHDNKNYERKSDTAVSTNKPSYNFLTQTPRTYTESGKFVDNGSPRPIIKSESLVSHTQDHDSVVSQGHEESKNKHDLQQTLSLNVAAITDNANNRHDNNNRNHFASKPTEHQITTTNIITPFNNGAVISKHINHSERKPSEVISNLSSSTENIVIPNRVNGESKSDETSVQINALDIYSKLSEIENVLNGKDSLVEASTNHPKALDYTKPEYNSNRKSYDLEINVSNNTRQVQTINDNLQNNTSQVLPKPNDSNRNDFPNNRPNSRGSGSYKFFERSTTERSYKYYEDLSQQNYPRETIEKLKLNKFANKETDINVLKTTKTTQDSVTTIKPVTEEGSDFRWIMVKTIPPTNIERSSSDASIDKNDNKFNNRIDRYSRNNANKNITDSKIVTISKYVENFDTTTKNYNVATSNSKEATNRKFEFNNNPINFEEKTISVSTQDPVNKTFGDSAKSSKKTSLDSGIKKDLAENLEQTLIKDSNNDGFVLETEESSYYGHDGDQDNTKSLTQPDVGKSSLYEVSSNRDRSEIRHHPTTYQDKNTERLSVNLNSGGFERGSRKFSATKFETISPFLTDSMTNKLYGTSTPKARLSTFKPESLTGRERNIERETERETPKTRLNTYKPESLTGNDLSERETPKHINSPKTYRGSIKYKYEPINYDWSEGSDEINNYPPQFEYTYKAPNDTDVYQKGLLKRINNRSVFVVHGSYKYTAPDGKPIFVTYTADEHGFHPQETKYFENKVNNLEEDLQKETVDELVEDTETSTLPDKYGSSEDENSNVNENV